MAYSPTPHSISMSNQAAGSYNARYRLNQASPSPPPQPIMNKRDKKRQAMSERLAEISQNFTENRDLLYRERMRSLQADMNYINSAATYDNKALEESDDEEQSDGLPGASNRAKPNASQKDPRAPPLGKHAAMFIRQVNDTLEERDAQLVRLSETFNFNIDQLSKDYEYNVKVAKQEHKRLMDTLRQRLITNVQAKKAALQRDKEKLDIADTSALLYHPNQFSMNNAASPGGPQGNRKTRHTRHRLEVEDLDTATAFNGKRKRKGPLEVDNASPPRDSEPTNNYRPHDAKQDDATVPAYSIDKLFTDKELNSHLQWACLKVLSDQQASKRRRLGEASGTQTLDISEPEDNLEGAPTEEGETANGDLFLDAPAMERSATNQSYHATRSTRNLNLINDATRENLGELAGRQAAAEMIGTYHREKKKEDEYNRAPPLSNESIEHDFALMAKAMKDEDQRRPSDTTLLDEVAGDRPNYIWMPNIDGDDT